MKKYLLLAILISISILTSCQVTKTITMVNAKGSTNKDEMEFLKSKGQHVAFLNLSEEQKIKAVTIWQREKRELGDAYSKKNKEIAPIIYKSENDFRSILTEEQLANYKETYKSRYTPAGLNDKQLAELKRIYKL